MFNNYQNDIFAFNCISLLDKEIDNFKKQIITPWFHEISILLTTNDIPSMKYVEIKKKILSSLTIKVNVTKLLSATTKEIYHWIDTHNQNKKVLGIIIQYPVSTNNRWEIIEKVNKFKDIDGLHKYWRLKLRQDGYLNTSIIPPTTYAIKQILSTKNIFLKILKQNIQNFNTSILNKIINNSKSLKIHVLGFSSLIGKPIYEYFKFNGLQVSFSNIETEITKKISLIKNSDIIIATTGKEQAISEKWLNNGQVIIDFGRRYKNNQVYGDVENNKLPFGVVHTTLFKSTGYATLAGLLHNISIFINMKRRNVWN